MEKTLLCSSSENQMIKDLSKALQECGIKEGFENYYEADEYSKPYFKIPKKFKKETPNDPDTCYIYLDVDTEYTVHGRYVHEHMQDERRAARLAHDLLTGVIVEVALVFPDRMAAFFLPNLGDPEKNVNVINDNAQAIMEQLSSPTAASMNFHTHTLFEPAYPYFLQCGGSRQPQIEGVEIYMISSVFAEHAEYYVIK